MNSKILVLSVAVIAVGLFALPSTMSLFSGQHTWYNLDEFPCQKCHQDIYDELTSVSNPYHEGFEASYGNACARCHVSPNATNFNKTGANMSLGQWIAYASKSTAITGSVSFTAHAAITVECLACHGTSSTAYANKIQGSSEAHRDFYYASVSDKEVGDVNYSSLKAAGIITTAPQWYSTTGNQTVVKLKGTNTACIGCHTHATVNITWKRSIGYEMTANVTNAGWDVNFTGVSSTTSTTTTSGGG